MKKMKTTQAASAMLGLVAGMPALVSAQQVTVPETVERVTPDVDDLKTSKIAHYGQLTSSSPTTAVAIANAIAHNRAAKAEDSQVAGSEAIAKPTAAAAPNVNAAVSAAKRSASASGTLKSEDFPSRTSQLAKHGTLAKQPVFTASVASAASLVSTSDRALKNALSAESAVSKPRTK